MARCVFVAILILSVSSFLTAMDESENITREIKTTILTMLKNKIEHGFDLLDRIGLNNEECNFGSILKDDSDSSPSFLRYFKQQSLIISILENKGKAVLCVQGEKSNDCKGKIVEANFLFDYMPYDFLYKKCIKNTTLGLMTSYDLKNSFKEDDNSITFAFSLKGSSPTKLCKKSSELGHSYLPLTTGLIFSNGVSCYAYDPHSQEPSCSSFGANNNDQSNN